MAIPVGVLNKMSDEELREIAKRKNRKGNCTVDANIASEILLERKGIWETKETETDFYTADKQYHGFKSDYYDYN